MLILVPTEIEARPLRQPLTAAGATLELCGFGPIAAAARTQQAIARHRPQAVLLLGIAGTYNRQLEVGQAYEFSQVACYGVGVGSGSDFQAAGELGWPQWQNTTDQLELGAPSVTPQRMLLTGCSASAGPQDVAWRTARYPAAMAEDMEGFGVALACQLSSLPLRIVRGISNHAGDRRHADWHIAPALDAVIQLALKVIEYRVEQPQ